MGLPDLAMRIWLNPERMASMGITAADVKSAIARQNQQFSAGTVAQDPLDRPAEVTVPVVTRGRFNTPAEFESIIIRASAEGSAVVRLGDVAGRKSASNSTCALDRCTRRRRFRQTGEFHRGVSAARIERAGGCRSVR